MGETGSGGRDELERARRARVGAPWAGSAEAALESGQHGVGGNSQVGGPYQQRVSTSLEVRTGGDRGPASLDERVGGLGAVHAGNECEAGVRWWQPSGCLRMVEQAGAGLKREESCVQKRRQVLDEEWSSKSQGGRQSALVL